MSEQLETIRQSIVRLEDAGQKGTLNHQLLCEREAELELLIEKENGK